MSGVCGTYGEKERCTQSLVGKPEGKRPLGKPRNGWEDNIKIDVQEIFWGRDWIDLALDRDRCHYLAYAVMKLPTSIKCR
jgi:hypothetical protein